MLRVNQFCGFGAGGGASPFLVDIIAELGLNTSLNVVLDAADLRSYDGSSQTWTDATGQANNFIRGTTTGADATDPSFVGVAGDGKDSTYFSFDGGDYFSESSSSLTFADNWHKNNGALSIMAVLWATAGASDVGIFTNGNMNSGGNPGVTFGFNNAEVFTFSHHTADATVEKVSSGISVPLDQWSFAGVSFDEATVSLLVQSNSTTATPAVSATTATAANALPILIGNGGAATFPFYNTMRLACLAAWSTPIGSTAMANLYTLLKARRFTTLP